MKKIGSMSADENELRVTSYLQLKKRRRVAMSADKNELKGDIQSSDEKETKGSRTSVDGKCA